MKLKINFGYKNLFTYIFIFIIILDFISLFYLFIFFKKNLYNALTFKIDLFSPVSSMNKDNINIGKFNGIISQIEDKQKPGDIQHINNIFY
jgi:hypothetical protein